MDRFLKEELIKEKVVFNAFFEFDIDITDPLIAKVFILINKYYPSFLITFADWNRISDEIPWEDFILDKYTLTSDEDFIMKMKIPMFLEKENRCEIELVEALQIYYGKEETTGKNSFGIDFYSNVFTDKRFHWNKTGRVEIIQKESAARNRKILASFLKELEQLLKAQITEFSSSYLSKESIYRYGIKDTAVLYE